MGGAMGMVADLQERVSAVIQSITFTLKLNDAIASLENFLNVIPHDSLDLIDFELNPGNQWKSESPRSA